VAAAVPPQLRELAERARPIALAGEQALPVLPALQGLLPGGALERGSTVAIDGQAATSLALALVARTSAAGSWTAAVGLPSLGLVAGAEAGLALERLVVVHDPSPDAWGAVVAALVEAFDVVLVAPTHRVRATDARRLAARSRERGSVLVHLERGPARRPVLEADVRLATSGTGWHGLGAGHGHLQARRVTVEASGRRRAARPRRLDLWLPDADGTITVADPATSTATVTPMHGDASHRHRGARHRWKAG
jgi:hypothetical protein